MTLRKNGDVLALPSYVPLGQAAKLTGLTISSLSERIKAGTIRAITINGEIAVSAQDAKQSVSKEDLPEYKQFKHLKGKPIWISEAARVYDVPHPVISRWVKSGIIKRIGKDSNKTLIDEADMAYCAFIYRQTGGQGKRIFNPDGTPYTPKSKALQSA